MGENWLDIYDVDVHSNAPASQSKAATLFSLFEPSGIFTLQLNLSWRHSRSSLTWPLFFQLPISSLTCFWRPKQGSRIDIGERGDWPVSVGDRIDRTASLLKLRSTISLCSTTCWQFHLGLGKGKCEESSLLSVGRTWERAKWLLAWQGCSRWRRAQIGCLRHRWAKRPRPDVLWSPIRWPKTNQWFPVGIIIRN